MMQKAEGSNFPAHETPPDRLLDDDQTLEIDGLTIVTREMGKAEANSATGYYVPSSGDLYVGNLVVYHLNALFADSASSEWLAALDRLGLIFPDAKTIHPGHGAAGPIAELLASQRNHIEAAREIAASIKVKMGGNPSAEAEAARQLKARFLYENPSGLPDIVAASIHGLFVEMEKPSLRLVP